MNQQPDPAKRRYLADYRNFTGVTTERQPKTHALVFIVDVDNTGIIRTKRVAFHMGPDRYQEYRYYTADQMEKIAEAMLAAVDKARQCAPSRNWTQTGRVVADLS